MYDERFARQYRYEPPSGFPLTSPCTGIVHYLSGPNRYALAQSPGYIQVSAYAALLLAYFTFISRIGLTPAHSHIY